MDRRSFFLSTGTAAAGIGLGFVGMSCFESTITKSSDLGPGLENPISYITPNDEFYVQSIGASPAIDVGSYGLQVDGLVAAPRVMTLDELQSVAGLTRTEFLVCIGNKVGGYQAGNAEWEGVLFEDFLSLVELNPSAVEVAFYCEDGYSTGMPIADLLESEAMFAWTMNGEGLPVDHGAPLRLLFPGRYGMKNPKWIRRIEFRADHYVGYWESRGWSDESFIPPTTRVDSIRSGDSVALGPVLIFGTAWATLPGVDRVEVSVDGGMTWNEAVIDQPETIDPFTWVIWHYDWEPTATGTYTIKARTFDRNGRGQPETDDNAFDGKNPIISVEISVTENSALVFSRPAPWQRRKQRGNTHTGS